MLFDPLNLLLLGIAVVVFWRLRGVLGSRTGTERPPAKPYSEPDPAVVEKPSGNILRFPAEKDASAVAGAEPPPPLWTGFAPEGSPLALAITELAGVDTTFTPKSFVAGAKAAYEMIIEAFAKSDKAALKDLLSRDVLESFASAIDSRAALGQTVEQRFVGIDSATITEIAMRGKRAAVTVKFVSEIITATKARDGTIIDGDDRQIRTVTDIWTFERDTGSRDPNWLLAATQDAA